MTNPLIPLRVVFVACTLIVSFITRYCGKLFREVLNELTFVTPRQSFSITLSVSCFIPKPENLSTSAEKRRDKLSSHIVTLNNGHILMKHIHNFARSSKNMKWGQIYYARSRNISHPFTSDPPYLLRTFITASGRFVGRLKVSTFHLCHF